MEKKLFADLVASLKEAAAIAKGKARPARQFEVVRREVEGAATSGGDREEMLSSTTTARAK